MEQKQNEMFAIGDDEDDEEGEEEEEAEGAGEMSAFDDRLLGKDVSQTQTKLINTAGDREANLDLLDDVVKMYPSLANSDQTATDIAVAKAACEPLIVEEDANDSNTYEIAFESSTQDSSAEKDDQ